MTPQQAARIVFLAGAMEAGYVLLVHHRLGSSSTYRSLWAIGVLTLGLAVFADFVPQIAGPFALLVLVSMAIRNRGELGQALGQSSSGQSGGRTKAPPKAAGGSGPKVV